MQDRSQYSAAASLLGYIYQCRLALLESLKRLKPDPDIAVAIETLDDVVFEKGGSPTEVIQVKHHIARKASLTNASTDLWKTIRIWYDLFSGGLSEENSILCLMTTEESAENSAARHLRIEGRNITEAETLLLQTSQTSSNESNRESLLIDNDLEQYDDTLIEEWAIRFDQAKDSLPVDPTSDDQIASGKKFFSGWKRRPTSRFAPHVRNPS